MYKKDNMFCGIPILLKQGNLNSENLKEYEKNKHLTLLEKLNESFVNQPTDSLTKNVVLLPTAAPKNISDPLDKSKVGGDAIDRLVPGELMLWHS